jgi:hypothetical protein
VSVGNDQRRQNRILSVILFSQIGVGTNCEDEVWEYSILNIPEYMFLLLQGLMEASPEIVTRLPKLSLSVRTVTYLNDP